MYFYSSCTWSSTVYLLLHFLGKPVLALESYIILYVCCGLWGLHVQGSSGTPTTEKSKYSFYECHLPSVIGFIWGNGCC